MALTALAFVMVSGFTAPGWNGKTSEFVLKKSSTDNNPPTVVLSLPAPTGNNGWYNKPVSIRVIAWDGESGIASKTISIGGAAWYKESLTIRREGSFVIYGQATDKAGNSMSTSVFINVDLTPPTVDFVYPEPEGKYDWYLGEIPISLSGSDDLSGVVKTDLIVKKINEDFIDDSTFIQGSQPSNLIRTYERVVSADAIEKTNAHTKITGSGRYFISGYVMDEAGNRTNVETELMIDCTKPEIFINSPDSFSGIISIEGKINDMHSGANKVFIDFGNGWERVKHDQRFWSFDWETDGLKDGEHPFSIKVSDLAGNEHISSSSAVVINHFWPIFSLLGILLSVGLIHLLDPRKYAWQDFSTTLKRYARMERHAAELFGKERQ